MSSKYKPPHTKSEIEKAYQIKCDTPIPKPLDPPNYDLIWANAVIRDHLRYHRDFYLQNPEYIYAS